MESPQPPRPRVRPGRRTRSLPMSLLLVLVALAACSGSAPTRIADTPVVTISAGESVDVQAPLQFHVRAQPAPATDLTVSVTIAADGCRPTQSLESVTIVAGEDRAVFTVLTTGLDAGAGGGCTVTAAIAAGEGYQVGAARSASATVMPVHQPLVTIAAGDSPVTEGGAASWTLSADPAPTTELTVNLAWTQSGDFLPESRPQTVTIPVSGAATVSVDTVDDGTDEPNGSVTLSVAVGSGYAVGTPSTAAVTVTDNDGPAQPVVTIRASGPTSIVEGATASWTLSATPAPTAELTVNLNWTQSGDFLPESRPQTVTIPVSGEATVSVDTVDDSTDEPSGTVRLSVVGGSGYSVGTSNTATVTVSDNDGTAEPVVTIRASGPTSIVEGATASWTLSATPAPTAELTVNLNWTQSGDFLPGTRPQTVTIPVSGEATVSVDTVEDSTDEPNGSVTLWVVGGSGYSVGTSNTATVTVSDNDPAGSRVATLHVTETQVTEGENITFQLKATHAFDNNGTIKVSFTDSGLGYTFTIDHVLFAGQTSRDLVRTVPDLAGNQADRTVTLSILVHTGYTVGSPGSATIIVIDSGN